MRIPRLSLALALAVCATAADRAARVDELRQAMRLAADAFVRQVERPGATPSIRDVTNCALTKFALGDDAASVEKLLRYGFAQQEMDPQSKRFGYVPWQVGHPEISDANSIEFFMQPIGPLYKHYGAKLSKEARSEFEPHIRAAFAAMRSHKVPVSYTNIFLMKTVSLMLSGEAIGDADAARDGYEMLDQWIAYTRQAGIHEFSSPTYYSVDLNSLAMGYLYASRPGARETFRQLLDYFWTDMAANYFPGRQMMSGAHSRDYDFLLGYGGLTLQLYLDGLREAHYMPKPDFEKVYMLESALNNGYRPGADVLKWASVPERVVVSRWDLAPERDRYHYLTPGFSLSTANGDYNAQDKMVAAELASAKELPVIAVVPDVFDAPWGKFKEKDRSGHSKPKHIPLHPVVVQEKGAVLALLDLDASREAATETLSTAIVLPAAAGRILLDGKAVDVSQPFERVVKPGSVVTVVEGKAAVAVRIFEATGAAGQEPVWLLKADREGLKYQALRLVVYHYRGEQRKLTDKQVRTGVVMAAAQCDDDAAAQALSRRVGEAKIDSEVSANTWTVRARIGTTDFEAAEDLTSHASVKRSVNGHAVVMPVLAINGSEIALR